MEFLALHKIVLLTVALCSKPVPEGFIVSDKCTATLTKVATLTCDLNNDEYYQCYHKAKKYFKIERTEEEVK
jgi:hypothetical protein